MLLVVQVSAAPGSGDDLAELSLEALLATTISNSRQFLQEQGHDHIQPGCSRQLHFAPVVGFLLNLSRSLRFLCTLVFFGM